MKRLISLLFFLLIAYSCSEVPVTGRKQLSLIPSSELLPMSFNSYQEVIGESELSDNEKWSNMVKRVGKRIQYGVEEYLREQGELDEIEGFEWEYHLIEEDVVNAWAMPGGKVAFYTGIMPICQDDNGVAVVMGHEIAHAVANHGGERMSQQLVGQMGLSTLSAALGQNPTLTESIFMQSVGMGTQLGMLRFSRKHESEADKIGLIFMSIAGYDPREAPRFWRRMERQSSGESPPQFLSTHPSHDTRIQDLNEMMPQALKYYKRHNEE